MKLSCTEYVMIVIYAKEKFFIISEKQKIKKEKGKCTKTWNGKYEKNIFETSLPSTSILPFIRNIP